MNFLTVFWSCYFIRANEKSVETPLQAGILLSQVPSLHLVVKAPIL